MSALCIPQLIQEFFRKEIDGRLLTNLGHVGKVKEMEESICIVIRGVVSVLGCAEGAERGLDVGEGLDRHNTEEILEALLLNVYIVGG
jgi:hypothetical protein